MKIKYLLFVYLLALQTMALNHPCMFLNQQEIDAIKVKIAAGQQPWNGAYAGMKNFADSVVGAGIPTILSGPLPTNGDPHCFYTGDGYGGERTDYVTAHKLQKNVRALGMAYAFSGQTNYAEKVIDYVRAWCINEATMMFPRRYMQMKDTRKLPMWIVSRSPRLLDIPELADDSFSPVMCGKISVNAPFVTKSDLAVNTKSGL